MQHAANSPWRTPASEYNHKPQFNLQHTVSMVNLQAEPAWYTNRGSSSPTASSASSCTSRSATPTKVNNNPWSNLMASPASTSSATSTSSTSTSNTSQSTNSSPGQSPNNTPEQTSRSTTPTPVAPQPMRPISMAGLVPMSPTGSTTSDDSFKHRDFATSPNPYRQAVAPLTPLVNGFINTSILSSQGQSLSGWFYELCRRQGWDGTLIKKIWQWTLSNPRIAILMYYCDDVASWRQASFFDLRDESLPFPEDRLQGIVADAGRLVDEQWRATSRELPMNGTHVDYTARETVPVQSAGIIRTSRNSEKSVDRARILGNAEDRLYIRKRFITARPSSKAAVLEQISKFKQHDHKGIAKLLCSYTQPSHVGIITERAQYNLDEYLSLPGHDSARSKQIVDWMYDLASAVEYLHSHSICHRALRPRKILIDGPRIFLAPFEIGTTIDTITPSMATSQRLDHLHTYVTDQSYIYAAPETIMSSSRGKRMADVFSLGCVLLSMMTVAQNQSLAAFTAHRAANNSQDSSFHAHLDRVASWRIRLHASTTASLRNGLSHSGRRLKQLRAEAEWLSIIEKMTLQRSKERVKMGVVMATLSGGVVTDAQQGKVAMQRRRSFDGAALASAAAAASAAVAASEKLHGQIGATGQGQEQGQGQNQVQNQVQNQHQTQTQTQPQDQKEESPRSRPELSVFDGYFQSQSRRIEPAGGW